MGGQLALSLYNDVQIIRETGWTEAELMSASEDIVWAIGQVMDLEGQKMKRESEGHRNKRPDFNENTRFPPTGYPPSPR